MITITAAAQEKIESILVEENNLDSSLRVFVQGGGCSGFQYGFVVEDTINDDDFTVKCGSYKILVDSISAQYLNGAEITYKDDLNGSSFSIKNPLAVTSCGCGSSFGV